MRPATVIGIILIILGLVGFAFGGFSYRHQKKDVDVGPLQISHEKKETVPIPPILSGIVLAGGIVLVIAGTRSR